MFSVKPEGESEPIADARPLADVRVLSVEQYGAGPFGTLQLADLGADVIKIEDPSSSGDVGRYVPPYQEGEDSLFFEALNRGKRSLSLDLRTAAGRRVFEDLVGEADAVFSNLRGDLAARLRLRYADLAHLNPSIVCCSLSGFGNTGPRAAQPAYDYVLQAMAGWMSITGEPDAPPTKTGPSLVDFSAGYVAMIALLAGLWRARRDGIGCDCDVSLHESALAMLGYLGTWAATNGHKPSRVPESAHPSIVPFQAFATADGWITVACAKEKFWLALCDALDLTELISDRRFTSFSARYENREPLLTILRGAFRSMGTDDAIERLSAAGVPVGVVNDVGAALRDPQIEDRGAVVSYLHPRFGQVRGIGTPLRLSGTRPVYKRAPVRGEHTLGIARELCRYSDAEIRQLDAEGAFGTPGTSAGPQATPNP